MVPTWIHGLDIEMAPPSSKETGWRPWFWAAAVGCSVGMAVAAEEIPARPGGGPKVDFARDIEPIFQTSCLRCHGPEKPKSHFRLDNRASALMGGDANTNDIVPGHSFQSMLIRYVAYAVEDMEMPPIGKGDRLSPHQVGLLRAWIDQGAVWSTTTASDPTVALEAIAGGFAVQGTKSKFRELEGVTDGFSGGVEKFAFAEQIGPNEKLAIDGHLLAPEQNLGLTLSLDKTDVGFVHAGFDQWRKYYASDGGFDSTVMPPQFNQNSDLYLDNGRAWIDFGLDLPHWPQMVLGYEYQYRDGAESTLDWGNADGKNIYPATQGVDERTHILKFDVTNDVSGWHMEDSTRAEFYTEKNTDVETGILSGSVPNELISTRDDYHHVQGMNTFMFEKVIRNWWLLSGGFYYSRLEGNDLFNQATTIASFNSVLNSQQITLERESEIFSLSSVFTPLDGLSLSVATQNEWTDENGFGASVPDLELGINTPASSSLSEFKTTQEANFRFTRIPYTVISGAAEWQQESVNEYQEEDPAEFMRDTVAENRRYDFQLGGSTSPWRPMELSVQVRQEDSETDYDHLLDLYNGLFGPTNGYPAFILNRDIRSDTVDLKLAWRAASWIKTTLTYQISSTDYSSKTDPAFNLGLMKLVSAGGPILDGTYNAQTYGLGLTLTPARRIYFSGGFTYSLSRALTAANGDPSIVPYQGDIYTFNAAATYALSTKDSLQLAHNFSRANYGENNDAAGVPDGLNYTRHDLSVSLTRKFSTRLSASLRYAFSQYAEPSSGTANNFAAQGIFAVISYRCR
jgi:mono/diheme cytochrome c family protein